jgi:hypothetical protein
MHIEDMQHKLSLFDISFAKQIQKSTISDKMYVNLFILLKLLAQKSKPIPCYIKLHVSINRLNRFINIGMVLYQFVLSGIQLYHHQNVL